MYGVPQGCILGPLLYVIFINDLPESMETCRTHLYADDTTLSVSSLSTNDVEEKLNNELAKVTGWMSKNQLPLNTSKTKIMKFSMAQTLNKVGRLEVKTNDTDIEVVEAFKYLGVMLDSRQPIIPQVSSKKGMLPIGGIYCVLVCK